MREHNLPGDDSQTWVLIPISFICAGAVLAGFYWGVPIIARIVFG